MSKKKTTLTAKSKPKIKLAAPLVLVALASIFFLNLYSLAVSTDPLTGAKRNYYSFSAGDHYYGLLQLWHYYAQKGDWSNADKLARHLDPADIQSYVYNHHPRELKKRYNQLIVKDNKSIDDLIELAKIQVSLSRRQDALETLKSARILDPIRSDLEKLYYQLLQSQ